MRDDKAMIEPRGQSVLTVGLMLMAGLVRLVPHPFNMTPMGALSLYSGARLPWWQAYLAPLLVMAVTDTILRVTFGWPFNPSVYGCYLVGVLLGRLLLTRTESPWRIAAASLAGSVVFFLVTNFSVWSTSRVDPGSIAGGAPFMERPIASPYLFPLISYADNGWGLAACYWLGLTRIDPAPPLGFAGNVIAADWFFAALMFGAHAALVRLAARRRLAASLGESP